jgi:hypothetical protein
VAQIYAGILGLLAFITCLTRGVVHGHEIDGTLGVATFGLLIFGVIGYVVGRTAAWIVEDSVRGSVATQVAAEKSGAATRSTVK